MGVAPEYHKYSELENEEESLRVVNVEINIGVDRAEDIPDEETLNNIATLMALLLHMTAVNEDDNNEVTEYTPPSESSEEEVSGSESLTVSLESSNDEIEEIP